MTARIAVTLVHSATEQRSRLRVLIRVPLARGSEFARTRQAARLVAAIGRLVHKEAAR